MTIGNIGRGVSNPTIVGYALLNATLKLDPYWLWYIQVAYLTADLQKGLSGVASLPTANGMFFDTGAVQTITVTCEQMLFPIGIVFFDGNLVVTEVVGGTYDVGGGVQPGSKVSSTVPARFFLECNPNEAYGITPGLVGVLNGYIPPAPQVPATPGTIFESMMPMMMMAVMMPVMGEMGAA